MYSLVMDLKNIFALTWSNLKDGEKQKGQMGAYAFVALAIVSLNFNSLIIALRTQMEYLAYSYVIFVAVAMGSLIFLSVKNPFTKQKRCKNWVYFAQKITSIVSTGCGTFFFLVIYYFTINFSVSMDAISNFGTLLVALVIMYSLSEFTHFAVAYYSKNCD
jgi:hypothetical protein